MAQHLDLSLKLLENKNDNDKTLIYKTVIVEKLLNDASMCRGTGLGARNILRTQTYKDSAMMGLNI